MQGWTQVTLVLAAALTVAAVITVVARLLLHSAAPRPGWIQIRPSLINWAAIFASTAITAFLACIALFIGSARADAATQMLILWSLVTLSLYCTVRFVLRLRAILQLDAYWQETRLDFRKQRGQRVIQPLSDVVDMRKLHNGGTVIQFSDRTSFEVDTQAEGLAALCNHVIDMNSDHDDAPPTE